MSSKDMSRESLIQGVIRAVYTNSTAAVFFHTAIAEQVGLGATEEKTLLILSGGPLTAGEIAQQTGLTTPSVTSLIDRLEKKGFVQRVRDLQDRRRVIVELNQEKFADLMKVFGSLQGQFDPLLEGYTDEQLRTIMDFLMRMTSLSQESMDAMRRKQEE